MKTITPGKTGPHEVLAGEPFEILLNETPSTGYKWQFQPHENFVRLIDDKFNLSSGAGIGGGGSRSLIFQIDQPGEITLTANLVRPWMGLASSVQQHSFTILVK